MKLGDIIIDYRSRNSISQREFARRAELSNSLISMIEKGVNPQTGKEISPDIETYMKIAMAMGINLQLLFEKLGDDARIPLVSLSASNEPDINDRVEIRPVIISDMNIFSKLMQYMSEEDCMAVMGAFARADEKMREAEKANGR